MKNKLLEFNRIDLEETGHGKLKNVSFFLRRGFVTALLGLDISGPELLVRLLLGRLPFGWGNSLVYFEGNEVDDYSQIKGRIYYYKEGTKPIETWTVAEYLFSDQPVRLLCKSTMKKMNRVLSPIFYQYGLEFSPMKKIGQLSELEQRKTELIKAVLQDAPIIIIEDECKGLSYDDIKDYKHYLRRIIEGKRAVLLISHAETVFQTLADDIVIFRKGRVVKKCFSIDGKIPFDWRAYVLGNTLIQKKQTIDMIRRKKMDKKEVIYHISGLYFNHEKTDLQFRRGEITTFLLFDNGRREDFFLAISGRKKVEGVQYILKDTKVSFSKREDFIRHKIISVTRLKEGKEVIREMSIEDNLFLPSQDKLSTFRYSMDHASIKQRLYLDFAEEFLSGEKTVKELSANELTAMTLERWYIFRPNVLILFDAFAGSDPYGISIIQSYVKKISNLGTSVIIVDSNLEYAGELSDRVFEEA